MLSLKKFQHSVSETNGCVLDENIITNPIIPDRAVAPEWGTPAYTLNDASTGTYGAPLPLPATFTVPDIPGTNQAASLEYGGNNSTTVNKITVNFKLVTHNGGVNDDTFAVIPVDWPGNELPVLSSTITPALSGGAGAVTPVGNGIQYSLAAADVGIDYAAEITLVAAVPAEGVWMNISMLEPPTGSSTSPVYELTKIVLNPERGLIEIPARQIATFGEDNIVYQKTLYTLPNMDLLNGTGELTPTQQFVTDCDTSLNPLGSISEKPYFLTETLALTNDTFIIDPVHFTSVTFYVKSGSIEVSRDGGNTWPAQYDATDAPVWFGEGNTNLFITNQIVFRALEDNTIIQIAGDLI